MLDRFCVLISVGPSSDELSRLHDVIDSIAAFEPYRGFLVLIDDSDLDRELKDIYSTAELPVIASLRYPKGNRPAVHPRTGGLCCRILFALSWIEENTDARFVLKLDTDSLVIRPFEGEALSRLRLSSDIGILGSVGRTSNPDSPLFGFYDDAREQLCRELLLDEEACVTDYVLSGSPVNRDAASILRERIKLAQSKGYELGKYCQGGAYILSRKFLAEMRRYDFYRDGVLWSPFPFGEDMAISMYSNALGLRMFCDDPYGAMFDVQWKGLPFAPDELLTRGSCFIHSLKNDELDEATLRAYFRLNRRRK